jgi:hypothetical protein
MFYDPRKKKIVDYGSSRACGENHNRFSIHAEQRAIHYCLKNDKKNKYKIFISRYGRNGNHKSAFCCKSCTKLAKKFNFLDKIFTFDEDKNTVSAILDNPEVSLAYKIKYGL